MRRRELKLKETAGLFASFLKIGAFTFGGGYAMIPLIREEVVYKRKWITEEDILDIIAIAESTPGPIAINSATFIGSRTAGIPGAFVATLGVVLPSFLIISAISRFLEAFESFSVVGYAFAGIRAGVLALLLNTSFSLYRQASRDGISYLIMGAAFIGTAFFDISVLWILLACGGLGAIMALRAGKEEA